MKESDLREILRDAEVDVVHKNSRGWLVIFWLVIGALSGYTPAMRFKPIPQDNQFEISEDGTIVRRIVPAWGTRVGKCLSLRENDGAYLRVKLMGKCYQVHVLVCTAFHGPPPEGKPFALHINDLPKDNHLPICVGVAGRTTLLTQKGIGACLRARPTQGQNCGGRKCWLYGK
jgi:hypothetical protein